MSLRSRADPSPTPNGPPANAVTATSSKKVAAGEVPHHDARRVCGDVQAQRNFRRAPPHQGKADPEDRQPPCSPPLAVDDDVLDREESGRHGNAETWLNQTGPGELLNRRHHAREGYQLDRHGIWRRLVWLLPAQGASQLITAQGPK